MGTLKQAVDRVVAAKTAIGNAITAKGGTVNAGDGLEDFAADIGTISTATPRYEGSGTVTNYSVSVPHGSCNISTATQDGYVLEIVYTVTRSSSGTSRVDRTLKASITGLSLPSTTVKTAYTIPESGTSANAVLTLDSITEHSADVYIQINSISTTVTTYNYKALFIFAT